MGVDLIGLRLAERRIRRNPVDMRKLTRWRHDAYR